MMVKRMIVVKAQQGWFGPDRVCTRSSLRNYSSYEIDSLYLTAIEESVSRSATDCACEKQRFNTNGGSTGPGWTGFSNYLGYDTPTQPHLRPYMQLEKCVLDHFIVLLA